MIGGGFPNGSVHGDVLNATPETEEAKVRKLCNFESNR